MAGGADDHGLFVFGADSGHRNGAFVEGKINHHVAVRDEAAQVLPQIELARDGQAGDGLGAMGQGLSHAALGAGNDDARHLESRP